ncbi:MAG: glycosyltransferase family 2 protein [Parachlamydiales bacterium]|nr:glycosyltransferase family 2 protein [Parachlamydiales bacterium]
MRKLLLFLGLAFFVFAGSFMAARFIEMKKEEPVASALNAGAYYPLKFRPFTIVVVGRNNGATVEKTLSSVFSQAYENFRLVYIDDFSDDGSFDVARDAIYASEYLTQVNLVQNVERLGVLANIYRAVQACPDDEIIVILDGDDWFAHEWVLQKLNAYYDDPSLWVSLAQGIDYPSYELAPAWDFKEGRHLQKVESHLKSFYAGLFKKVRESDFVYSGTFLPAAAELAYMTPMLEMGRDHFQFIPEVLSVNNRETLRHEDRELVLRCEKFIRSLDPYPPLTALQVTPCGD